MSPQNQITRIRSVWTWLTSSLSALPLTPSTRHVQSIYDGQFHVPVQPHASQTSQRVVRIHHFDRRRLIIANQIVPQSHSIHSETLNEIEAGCSSETDV